MEANRPDPQDPGSDAGSGGGGSSSGAGVTSPAPAAAGPARSSYSEAVELGCEMAVLYRNATRQPTKAPALPDTLPTLRGSSPGRRTEFAIAETCATLARLKLDGTSAAAAKLEAEYESAEATSEKVKRCVYELHLAILRECNASDRALGKAYELGKSLADTCPGAISVEAMAKQLNRYRLDELGRWLADLASRLPDHSSRAVRISMARWKIEAKDGPSSPLFTKQEAGILHRELDRQVQIWRSMLTGEKSATDMLGTDGYARAVGFAVGDTRRILTGYIFKFLPYILVVMAVLAAGIWGVLEFKATSKVIASFTAIATALGLSWKGVASTLGHVAGEIETPIWQGSLDLVVADAITQQPAAKVALNVAARVSTAAGGSSDTRQRLGAGKVAKALPPGTDARPAPPSDPSDEPDDAPTDPS
jgi:hypothetical protein